MFYVFLNTMNRIGMTLSAAAISLGLAGASQARTDTNPDTGGQHMSIDEVQALIKAHSQKLCMGTYASPMADTLTIYPEFRDAYLACSDFVQDYPELAQDIERRGIAGVTGKMVPTASESGEEPPASLVAILESHPLDSRLTPIVHERIRQLVRYVERIPPSGLDILQQGYGSGILTVLSQQTLGIRGARRQQEIQEEERGNERIVMSLLMLLA